MLRLLLILALQKSSALMAVLRMMESGEFKKEEILL